MKILRIGACTLGLMVPLAPIAAEQPGELEFEISTLPGLSKHAALLEHPGYLAIVLENSDLRPSLSSKLVLKERGTEVEARNAVFRFVRREGDVYSYEAGLSVGVGDVRSRLTFPVSVDASLQGKVTVSVKPPLADLLPAELVDRIQLKMRMVANAAAQKKVLDYLDQLAKTIPPGAPSGALFEAILFDAYNRSGGPAVAGRDVGDALPLSDQWMLILTLAIWLIVVPAALLAYRWRRGRRKPA